MKNALARLAILSLLVAYGLAFQSERLSQPSVALVVSIFVTYCIGYELYRFWKFLRKNGD
ncbi:hypothetical protein SAMN05444003_2541 [Cognatiyoonia sediminum]|uniref:Uncharacterized protein n=1 Tax=Cognatiyoonia sediminum TaxID=1508389 RepID=A0A1M5REZ3_9RHOB|nr:hypothetical protein SAMN05444003_2541 [Cognatiyoonia sediminum]